MSAVLYSLKCSYQLDDNHLTSQNSNTHFYIGLNVWRWIKLWVMLEAIKFHMPYASNHSYQVENEYIYVYIYAILPDTTITIYSTVRIPPSDSFLCHTQSVTYKQFIWQLKWDMKNNTTWQPLFNLQQTSRDYPLAILTMKLRVCCKKKWREELEHY